MMTGPRSFLIFLFLLMEILFYGAETSDVLPGISNTYSTLESGKVARPFFEMIGNRNVSFVMGHNAYLQCRVRHLGDKTVSWIRKRDLHVLTSNLLTFTGDARFSVIHPQDSDDWTLEIKYVQKRDAGVYECQVNTEPKMNMALLLSVDDRENISEHDIHSTRSTKEAQATISGPEFVRTTSTISLTCTVNIHSQPAGSVTWYHRQNVVDFNSPRGGISMETTKSDQGTVSKLVITKAASADAGNYTCQPSNAGSASVMVHVVNGEHSEPIHHNEHGRGSLLSSSILITFITFCLRFFVCQVLHSEKAYSLHSIV